MITVSDELKSKLMENSVHKELVIKGIGDTSPYNLLGGYLSWARLKESYKLNEFTWWYLKLGYDYDLYKWSSDLREPICNFTSNYLNCTKYICFSFLFRIEPLDIDTSNLSVIFTISYSTKNEPSKRIFKSIKTYKFDELEGEDFTRVWFYIKPSEIDGLYELINICYFISRNDIDATFTAHYGEMNINLCNELSEMPPEHANKPDNLDSIIEKELFNSFLITSDNIDKESFSMTEALCSANNIKFGLCESSYCSFSIHDADDVDLTNREFDVYLDTLVSPDKYERLPLGRFKSQSVKKKTKGIYTQREITAYDGLSVLEGNAADWYTQYIYALSLLDYESRYGFEYSRQVYSSYFNLAKQLGIETREYYTENEILYFNLSEVSPNIPQLVNKYSKWISDPIPPASKDNTSRLHYAKFSVSSPDTKKRYVVDLSFNQHNIDNETQEYREQCDSLLRGITTANILIEEVRGNNLSNKFLVDPGDYFMISPECTSFNVYIPALNWFTKYGFDSGLYINEISIKEVQEPIELTNGHIRLMYYNYNDQTIFPCESSITGRDVIRSLLEVCGCFFMLDREGKPQFKYCTKSGLYPSNELYPADDLFPRDSEGTLPTGLYYDFECEDYSVKDYGKIQILKKTTSSEAKSICEWQYVGDETKENTYIIDDNIFYCSELMEYEYDSMPEVSEMLENMFLRISNMGFTPQTVNCIGMPYLECGDRIILLTENSGTESFVFERTLSGIVSLVDAFESKGDEVNEAINDFGYKVLNGGT